MTRLLVGGGLSYAQQILTVFAHAGYPCPFLQEHHITPFSLKQGTEIYQDIPPLGGRDSVMRTIFGQNITNQHLTDDAAAQWIHILTIGNKLDFLFGPQACNVPVKDFLSSQWLADEGNTSGVYGCVFAAGQKNCASWL